MNTAQQTGRTCYARTVALHSLGWLVAANVVGVWMAVSLLWPAVGDLLAPLTFGRWTPLHLDWQLYGWCSLPLVGALLAWYFDPASPTAATHARVAFWSWTAALVLGGVAWLGGSVSGKLFLDWHGWSRPLLPAAMLVLWALLARHAQLRWSAHPPGGRVARVALLAGLLVVPGVLFWATGRDMYHPVNPDSGGATGTAVLGSTLGIIAILLLLPRLLGVAPRASIRWILAFFGASWIVFVAIGRGNVSHHETRQIIGLATLFAWIPLLPIYWFRHAWPIEARPWLRAATTWWCLLVVTGWISFLPGVSEILKFTHALVGHAHLAMAALVTSVNAAVLAILTERAAPRSTFWLWQVGVGVYVLSMFGLGVGEVGRAAELFRGEAWTQALLGVRLVAGLAMTTGSMLWLLQAVRTRTASP